jgi:hypothetical protein
VFSVTVTGPGPLSYQWSYNGTDIPGATSRMLGLSNVQLAQSGDYVVRVTNPYAAVEATGRLIVLVAPTFTENPQSVTVLVGDTVTFRASVFGTQPMGFRWRRNSITYVPFELGTPTLIIPNVQVADNGSNIDVAVTNRASLSPGRLSGRAVLTVLADTDGDRAPDSWENSNGFNSTNSNDGAGDADDDGATNVEEYMAGTNPNDPTSYLRINSIAVGGNTSLQFLAVSNKNYTVQFSDELGQWSTLAHVLQITNPPPVRSISITDSNAAPQRYYRLVTPYQP